MSILWAVILGAVAVVGGGAWRVFAPLDVLWAQQERRLLARGLAPQRTDAWESNVRIGGWGIIAIGIVTILVLLPALAQVSAPKMSGVSINGHELTQEEWDGCHQDASACLSQYASQPH